uniref:Uncharacterized protein n=1 Tax=Anguilla anguilla TaxID=7936 RepID=A0A0E9TEG0_ANGAN
MLWVCVYMCMLIRCVGVVSNTKLIFTSCFDLRSLSKMRQGMVLFEETHWYRYIHA